MRLNNTTIYSSATSLFVTSGDHNLVEITGTELVTVERILLALEATESLDDIYARLRDELDDDRDYFDDIITWLLNQGILLPAASAPTLAPAAFVYAPHLAAAARTEIIAQLNKLSGQQYTLAGQYQEAGLIIALAPLFDYLPEVQALSQYAYQQGITVCHLGLDTGAFTLGPIVNPAQRTPCLHCYLRRKLANLKNPQQTLTFIEHTNKRRLTEADPRRSPYFQVALTHLALELETYFAYQSQMSPLLGRSVVFEHAGYRVQQSKVLRVPDCPVYNPAVLYAALNP